MGEGTFIEPGAFRKFADVELPLTYHGNVVGTARISEDGQIVNAEFEGSHGWVLAAGIRTGLLKSISIRPNYTEPNNKENNNARTS